MVDTSEASVGDRSDLTIREKRSLAKRAVYDAKRALRIAEEGRDAVLVQQCTEQLAQARRKRNCLLPAQDLR